MKACSLLLAAAASASAIVTNSTKTNSTSEGLIGNGEVSLGDWTAAYKKAKAFTDSLTTAEKITIITGGSITNGTVGNFTALTMKDGSQGAQGYFYESGFGQTSALGMTWDRDAVLAQAAAVGLEYYQKGVPVINGPETGPMGRTVWNGRGGESFGPDAYLNGILIGISTKAYVDAGIIPAGKHFILYEQETNRNSLTGGDASSEDVAPYNSNADDKTIHETYMWPWYDMVKNGAGGAMCTMNEVNGTYACENKDLLMGLLKTELGFPGFVVADVTAQHTAYGSAIGGLDYSSSEYWPATTIEAFLSNGTISKARLDDMVIRNVIGYYFVGMDDGKMPTVAGFADFVDTRGNHSEIIRANGAKSIALLKNTGGALPLNKPRLMAIFGANAGPVLAGPTPEMSVQGSGPTYQGHLGTGSGSAQSSLPYLIDPYTALVQRAASDKTMVRWILNDTYTSSSGDNLVALGNDEVGAAPSYIGYAEESDVCLVFLNALAGEGVDRTELTNADQDTMVNSVTSYCNNTIVVIQTTGARLMDAWIENENVTAVLYSAPLGQESGNSILDVLYGDVNPSGRLIYTIAKNETDYNVPICETKDCNYTEGNYIDYKSFDYRNVTPRYEFGYGLSYTTFNYSSFSASVLKNATTLSTYAEGTLAVGGRTDLWDNIAEVEITLTNTGSRDGAEIPQLYISYPADSKADQPLRQLRGFDRVGLAQGESKTVTFELRRRDLSFWDVEAQEWALARGTFDLLVGSSSRDFKLNGTLVL